MKDPKNKRIPLIQARIATGLSIKEVAERVGVSATIVWRLENSLDVDTRPEVKEAIRVLLGMERFPEKADQSA